MRLRDALVVLFSVAASPAFAQGGAEFERLRLLFERQQSLLDEQRRELDSQRETLARQQREIELLKAGAQSAPPSRPVEPQPEMRASQAPRPAGPVGVPPPAEEPRPPEIAVLDEAGGGVLTPRGRLTLEPSVEYAHSSTDRFIFRGVEVLPSFLIGVIDVTEADRDAVFATMTGRFGATDRLELEARVPYVYRDDRLRTTTAQAGGDFISERQIEGFGLGDVEAAAHYQFNRGLAEWPIFVGNLRVKSDTGEGPFDVGHDVLGLETELPTGSGFWGVEPSLTAIYSTDPAVFFANFGYLWNVGRDVDTSIAGNRIGHVDPGDAVRVSFGMGIGLNERTSFSVGYEHSYIMETSTELNGVDVDSKDLQVGSFLVGFSHRLNDRVGLNLNLAIGATEDAPDVRVTLRVPVSFEVF
jgi:hypothetical protein